MAEITDLFGLQAWWRQVVYPIITHPLMAFVLLLLVVVIVYYEFTEHRLERQRLERVIDRLAVYIKGTQSILDLVFTEKGRKEIETVSAVLQAISPQSGVESTPGREQAKPAFGGLRNLELRKHLPQVLQVRKDERAPSGSSKAKP